MQTDITTLRVQSCCCAERLEKAPIWLFSVFFSLNRILLLLVFVFVLRNSTRKYFCVTSTRKKTHRHHISLVVAIHEKKIFQLNASRFFKCASKPINTQMMYVCAARAIHTALIASFITFCAPHFFPRSIFLFIIIMFFRLFCLLYVEHLCVICRSSESEWFGRIKNIRAHILGKSMHRFVISNNNN